MFYLLFFVNFLLKYFKRVLITLFTSAIFTFLQFLNKNKYFIALFRNEQHNRKRFIIKDQPEPETTPTKLLCIKKQVSTSEVAKNSFYEFLNCQINDKTQRSN